MTSVRERVVIDAPYVQAVGAFEARLGFAHGSGDGRSIITLVAPSPDGREIARDVEVTAHRIAPGANYTTRYHVAWSAGQTRRGIPTPGFEGTITLRAGEDYAESELELDGRYDPPGGVVGRIFDDIAGRRIAHATLGALLDGVRQRLRASYAENEAAKTRPAKG